jgi:hypothetical protein
MRIYTILTVLAGGASLVACNEALVPEYNVPTGFQHNVAAVQNEITGAISGARVDMVFFEEAMDGFARNTAYFTNSEQRFVTQLTGQQPLDDDNFGAQDWNTEYQDVKDADSVIAVLPTLTYQGKALPTANVQALQGTMETIKALSYMYILLAHDTVGIAINNVGGPGSGNLAPIVCARNGWREMIAILDTAEADFKAAPLNTPMGFPGTTFQTLQVPPTYSAIGNTPGGWLNFVYALRGRFRVELAYATANGPGGVRPTETSPGGPDLNQLDSAVIDITASSLYTPALNAGEAVAPNDLGVFHYFSNAAGDLPNPLYVTSAAQFVLEQAAQQIDTLHDQRFIAKWAQAPSLPTSPGNEVASSYAWFNNMSLNTPIPIVRNIELQFLLARAYLGLGQYAKAAQIVDNVRTVVGGLSTALPLAATDYTHVRDFLMREMIPSLMGDDTGDQIAAIRDYGLIMQDLDLWSHTAVPQSNPVQYYTDQHTSQENIPAVERQQRNNNFAPVCN